jgi:hypothetical protein
VFERWCSSAKRENIDRITTSVTDEFENILNPIPQIMRLRRYLLISFTSLPCIVEYYETRAQTQVHTFRGSGELVTNEKRTIGIEFAVHTAG